METNLADKIKVKQTQVSVENNPVRKQELQQQLRKLQLRKEIEQIKKQIEQLG
jgi:hypothetical protein